jgi:micrococcal nuclease
MRRNNHLIWIVGGLVIAAAVGAASLLLVCIGALGLFGTPGTNAPDSPPPAITQPDEPPAQGDTSGETARVISVVDGDTIDVQFADGRRETVRYIGVNTTERGETCYGEGRDANARLVEGQNVRLVRDISETDRFGRLLRYVYVGSTFVNAQLVVDGWAEAVEYRPDTRFASYFADLERQAQAVNAGCHALGAF